jgi:hypothetical protein
MTSMTCSDRDDLPVLGQTPSEPYQPEEIEGWTARNTVDEPRLSELVELYEEIGFEVMLRPVSPDHAGEACTECVMVEPERYRTIYTRPKSGG